MSKVTKQEIIDALRDASSYAFYRDLSELADRIEAEGIALPSIDALIAEAVAKEREACAKVCEETTAAWTEHLHNDACVDCAEAIRAMGQKYVPMTHGDKTDIREDWIKHRFGTYALIDMVEAEVIRRAGLEAQE